MAKKAQKLYLLANAFPYGNWEPYLETEIQYYGGFDAVRIFSLSVRPDQKKTKRQVGLPNTTTYPIDFASKFLYLLYAVRALFDCNLYRELVMLMRTHRFSFKRLVALFVTISRSHYECGRIMAYLSKCGDLDDTEPPVIYTYRFAYQAYLAVLLRKRLGRGKIVARAHGFDLYEDSAFTSNGGYFPLRNYCLEQIASVYLIANCGKKHLATRYPARLDKLKLSYLGTHDHGRGVIPKLGTTPTIVTCSALVPVKQINRLIATLSMIKKELHWIHFGEGPLSNELQQKAKKTLPSNISYEFCGFISNQDLMKFYGTHPVNLFANVSSSEGIPVSIMEALSFGIPCLATDVGGNGEIVSDGINGRLIPDKFSDAYLAQTITEFLGQDDASYQQYRSLAYQTWNENFNADINYKKFVAEIAII